MEKGGIRLVEVTFDQTGVTSDEQTAQNICALKEMFEGMVGTVTVVIAPSCPAAPCFIGM